MEFREMTAAEIGQKIKTGEMTAVDAVKAALAETSVFGLPCKAN